MTNTHGTDSSDPGQDCPNGNPDDCRVCKLLREPRFTLRRIGNIAVSGLPCSPGDVGHPGTPGPAASYSGELHDSPDCWEFSPRAASFCCSPLHGAGFMKISYPKQSTSPYIENRFIANANLPEAEHAHDAGYWRARALNAEARAERAERLRRIWRDTTVSQKETASRLRVRIKGLEMAAGLTRFDLAVQRANAMLQADTIKKRTEERDQAVERAESAERMATVWQDIARRWEKTSNGWKAQAQNWQGVAANLEGMRLTFGRIGKEVFPRMDFHGRSTEAGTES